MEISCGFFGPGLLAAARFVVVLRARYVRAGAIVWECMELISACEGVVPVIGRRNPCLVSELAVNFPSVSCH